MRPKRTILCVDDNEQSLSVRKVLLETRGYRVIGCTNGTDALECFRKGGVDLVLTDLVMPGMDGSTLIDEIKKISPQTPAILHSGKIRIYDHVRSGHPTSQVEDRIERFNCPRTNRLANKRLIASTSHPPLAARNETTITSP